MVQVIPEIRDNITKGKNWREIADFQIKNYFNLSPEEAKKRWRAS